MANVLTIPQFVNVLAAATGTFLSAEYAALDHAGGMVEREAERVLGTYDYGWPQLAPSTQARRAQAGFSPNEPLLVTHELRDSIHHQVNGTVTRMEVDIGSDNPKAIWHELGTSHHPPRPFLMPALVHEEQAIVHAIGPIVLRGFYHP